MNSEEQQLGIMLENHCEKLIEHCDSVRIFVTFHNGNTKQTSYLTKAAGNLYASEGAMKQWFRAEKELDKLRVRSIWAEKLEDEGYENDAS